MLRALAAACAVVVATLGSGKAAAQAVETNILTGGPAGTYIQIGRDVASIGAECGFALNVRESAGSIENFLAVRDRPVTQFGIVQSDVLEYFQTFQADDPAIRRAVDGIRIAFPLYDEEVHILARREIASLADLAGRRVAVGVENSGTYITARLMLDLTGIEPAEQVTIGPDASLQALLAGDIDAFFYVVGAPAELFRSAEIEPASYHLLPLTEPALRAVYTPAEIAAGMYPINAEAVPLVAVKAILVTFDFDRERNAYHRASCAAVADLGYLIATQLDRLRTSGHPKWQSVDMTALPPGWEVSDCLLDGLAPGYGFTCRAPDGSAVEEAQAAPEGPNELYLQRLCARIDC